jgi:hypothetical protein
MASLTPDVARRLERLPEDLRAEFPSVQLETIRGDVDTHARELLESARFDDFVPVLVHRAVREALRSRGNTPVAA